MSKDVVAFCMQISIGKKGPGLGESYRATERQSDTENFVEKNRRKGGNKQRVVSSLKEFLSIKRHKVDKKDTSLYKK